MKILNIMLSKGIGGLEYAAVNTSIELLKKSVQVFTLLKEKSKIQSVLNKNGIDYLECPAKKWFDFSTNKIIKNIVKENDIDIILAHGRRAIDFSINIKKVKLEKYPKVVSFFHNDVDFGLGKIIKSDFILALNRDQKRRLIEAGFKKDNIILVKNMLNINEEYVPLKPKEGIPFIIGGISRLEEAKGFDLLINACKILKNKGYDIKLKIAGAGPLFDYLNNLVKAEGLLGIVEFSGYISEKRKFFESLDIFVNSSRREPFGLNTIEGMYYSIPVIATKTFGSIEIITDRESGLLVDIDEKSIAKGIESLILDKNLRERLSKNGRLLAENQYTGDVYANNLIAIFKDILKNDQRKK